MPLLGKVVIIKRNGTDGTEFPLTAPCLFGRKLDCDIRIQLPQVSKEQCRIEPNENKELILTNLSSVNPTRINGEIVQQSERLKHGDLITIIDRSFRFEYPPPPTPKKKRLSTTEKGEPIKVLLDQHVSSSPSPTEKKKSEHSLDSCLKDGSNLPSALDQSIEVVKSDASQTTKPEAEGCASPFFELYNMVKQDLASRTPRRAPAPSTPLARSQNDNEESMKSFSSGADVSTDSDVPVTPKPAKKKRRSSTIRAVSGGDGVALDGAVTVQPEEGPLAGAQILASAVQHSATKQKRRSSGPATPVPLEGSTTPVPLKENHQPTPQKFSANEVAQQILSEHSDAEKTPKSPKGRGGVGSRSQSPAATPKRRSGPQTPPGGSGAKCQTPPPDVGEPEPRKASRTSPRENAGKRFQVEDVLGEVGTALASGSKGEVKTSGKKHKKSDLPVPVPKRKRVSFGGQLSPELFDKRLPPNSPLRRGATPRRQSLSMFRTPQSLLRRASTIGLMSFRLSEAVPEKAAMNMSPKRASSPGKSAKVGSPTKIRSPAKKAASPKAKKSPCKTPPTSESSATPKTPSSNSSSRSSKALVKTSGPSEGSFTKTPTVRGRFSVSRISTPSPVSGEEKGAKGEATSASAAQLECTTPNLHVRRSSMKASTRKTPRSALKSAIEVMRSRRSGASRANLKVVSSWADVVKFGQVKLQTEVGTKTTVPRKKTGRQPKVTQHQTPVRRLKNITSTGHADSPVTVVIGKAHMRSTQPAGVAPKMVSNVVLFTKDRKMDEDFTGLAEIFKTPANSKTRSVAERVSECPETPLGVPVSSVAEMSVMDTPEESGEMVVSPMSVASTANLGRYNSEAVSRLLQDNQDASLIQQGSPSQVDGSHDVSASEVVSALEMSSEDQTEEETLTMVQTPQQKLVPLDCLTGVKKLMTTPKQRTEPIEDLRGRLLRTPREPKPSQEGSLEGLKELFYTPKQNETCVEHMTGLKKLLKTPKVDHSPVVCAAGLSRLMKTPKDKIEQVEDLTGVKQLMQTPKIRGEPVEKAFGLKRLIKTPKQKSKPVEEDLTGISQMMKTPKQKCKPVEEDLTGISQMMKTPKQKSKPVEEDLTGIKQMMKTPKQRRPETVDSFTEPAGLMITSTSAVTDPEQNDMSASAKAVQIQEPLVSVASGALAVEGLDGDVELEDKENICPAEDRDTNAEDRDTNAEDRDTNAEDRDTNAEAAVIVQSVLPGKMEKTGQSDEENKMVSVETSSPENGQVAEAAVEAVESSSQTAGVAPPSPALKQGGRSCGVKKPQRGGLVKLAQRDGAGPAPAAEPGKEERAGVGAVESAPALRGRRAKVMVELLEAAPVPSPARKSARGRVPKRQFEEEEGAKTPKPDQGCAHRETDSKRPPVDKARRGRRTKPDVEVEPVLETKAAVAPVIAETPVEVEVTLKSPTPVAKGKRGRGAKQNSENCPLVPATEEPQVTVPEAVAVGAEMTSEGGELQSEAKTKTKRGRGAKKETLKAAQVEETSESPSAKVDPVGSDVTASDGQSQTSAVKLGRGRRAKPGGVKEQAAGAETQARAEPPPARSSRGAKPRALKPQTADQPAEPSSADPEPGQHAEVAVKNVRGRRRAPQTKACVSEDSQEEGEPQLDRDTIGQTETARSARGRRTAAARDEPVPARRGRRAAAATEVPLPAIRASRGRKAAVRTEDAPASEKVVVEPSETALAQEKDQTPGPSSAAEDEVMGGKGRRRKKAMVSSEDGTVEDEEEVMTAKASAADCGNRKTSKKTVNWNSDLVCCKDIEEVGPPVAEEEPKQKSKRKASLAATVSTELSDSKTQRPEDLPSKCSRGKGVRRRGQPATEQLEVAVEESAPLGRRGRASTSRPADAGPKRGRKKEMEAAAEESPDVQPLPETKATGAACAQAVVGVPAKRRRGLAQRVEENPVTGTEHSKPAVTVDDGKPTRGKRKARDVSVLAEDSVAEVMPRRGTRAQKKTQADVSSAPPKRTRRQ
ncbi:proliferation marker protein Ki-67 [Brachyhypopomus gauderio]|uniref:proliferation marker protein Ki-67 n=1 Tax=Brachyhypopomus gauderio TaxID=698409 RepID=UPI0040433D80